MDKERITKLDEWFQELQQSMFGDNLPEPKPKDINRLIGPPQFLSHVELQDRYKNFINPLFLPYMSYFTLSGLAHWYHALSIIFLFDEIKPKKLMFGVRILSYIVDYLKEEEQVIEEEKEFFLPTYKILGIDLNDYLNQLAFAVKRIVFHK